MSNNPATTYEKLCQHARQTAVLSSVADLLGWDEQTLLPAGGHDYRAEQLSLLAGLVHQRATDPQIGSWLDELSDSPLAADPESDSAATLRELRRTYDKRVRLPQALVEELTRTATLAQAAWQEARRNDDYPHFAPWLEKIYKLKREEAAATGTTDTAYDALLDDYEPEMKTAEAAAMLDGLRAELVPLVQAIAESGRAPDRALLERPYPVDVQEQFGREASRRIGFDFERGRLDTSPHPFCSTSGPHDCRLTTRYDEHGFGDAFFSTLHESGHGLYEQGLPTEHFGLPLGSAVSLGVHESQSRLWENLVGRSRAFWEYLYPELVKTFPTQLKDVSLHDFYFAVNDVRPSLIRTESDEATYNLHICVRFELELALLNDELKVADLPAAWRDKYAEYVGIAPSNDADGVLQDIHWSGGLVGYFPTYSLGNLYAAQLYAQADRELGGVDSFVRRGEFAPLLEWLREKVHRHGSRYRAVDLIRQASQSEPSAEPLMEHLRSKLTPLYGL